MNTSARRWLISGTLGVVLAALLPGCGTGLALSADTRVIVETPHDMSLVRLPFKVQWTLHGNLVERLQHKQVIFAVFVDRSPVAPGQNVTSVIDDNCRDTPGCPDTAWYASQGIWLTRIAGVDIDSFPGFEQSKRSLHRLTVVLLDPTGRRLGETAWSVQVFTPGTGGSG